MVTVEFVIVQLQTSAPAVLVLSEAPAFKFLGVTTTASVRRATQGSTAHRVIRSHQPF